VLRVQNPVPRVAEPVAVGAEYSKFRYIAEAGKALSSDRNDWLAIGLSIGVYYFNRRRLAYCYQHGRVTKKPGGHHRSDIGGSRKDAQGRGGEDENRKTEVDRHSQRQGQFAAVQIQSRRLRPAGSAPATPASEACTEMGRTLSRHSGVVGLHLRAGRSFDWNV
jgi:hypothetical protein